MKVKIQTNDGVPQYAHEGDAALDLRSTCDYRLDPREWHVIPSGIKIELPKGYAALVLPRSGLATKQGVTIINSPGLIDSGYRGEIGIPLLNVSNVSMPIKKGDRVAQLMVIKVENVEFERVESLEESDRGEGGFGSTGVK